MNLSHVVGIDFGRGDTKGVLDRDHKVIFPSVVAEDVNRRFGNLLASASTNGHVHIELKNRQREIVLDRLVGKTAIMQNPLARAELHKERPELDIVTLVGECLYKLGLSGKTKLVVGAPVDYYKQIRDKESYSKLLVGDWFINGRKIEVSDLIVLPEGVGVFYSLTLNFDGSYRNRQMMVGRRAVIDIGMYTTDVVWFEDSVFVEPRSFSVPYGVASILKALKAHLLEEYGQDVPYFSLAEPMRTGKAWLNSASIDLSAIINQAAQQLSASILSSIRSAWKDKMGLLSVHVAGGGSYYTFSQFSEEYGGVAIPVIDAEWENAFGFGKFGRWKFGDA